MTTVGQVKTVWRGVWLTARQADAFDAAEKAIRRRYWGFRFTAFQGSWRPETSYSGTTHTQAGVADLGYADIGSTSPRGKEKYRYVLRTLRQVGHQAAFGRGPWNAMPYHYHVCDLNVAHMAPAAQWQVAQYGMGYDGLTAGAKDPYPFRPNPLSPYPYWEKS
jgi:hypothetical protein